MKAKADCDISKLKEKLLIATEALGEKTLDQTVTSGYGNELKSHIVHSGSSDAVMLHQFKKKSSRCISRYHEIEE